MELGWGGEGSWFKPQCVLLVGERCQNTAEVPLEQGIEPPKGALMSWDRLQQSGNVRVKEPDGTLTPPPRTLTPSWSLQTRHSKRGGLIFFFFFGRM